MKILVSAGEASGDRYAAELVAELKSLLPQAEFFGSAGPRMREQGVRAVVRTESLAVVGIFEVVRDIPRIWGEFRRLISTAEREQPALAILTDSPDFNVRVAAKLKKLGIPVVYYVAPQMWAWRPWRVHKFRRLVDQLLCIFPFEKEWFEQRGVSTRFVGHPLADAPPPALDRAGFCEKYGLDAAQPVVAILPGSRKGEALRHLPALTDAVARLREWKPIQFVLPASATTGAEFFRERIREPFVTIVENDVSNVLGAADTALIASGTASTEAALHATPMVVFYKVTPASWVIGKLLVRLPFYSMVNLLAGREVVKELIQADCTGERLAAEARELLQDERRRSRMRDDLAQIREMLKGSRPAARQAAETICERLGRIND